MLVRGTQTNENTLCSARQSCSGRDNRHCIQRATTSREITSYDVHAHCMDLLAIVDHTKDMCSLKAWIDLLPTVSQCNPLPPTKDIDFHCTHKLMWAKNSGKISLLTNYRIFWNPQIRYKRSPIYHWVSKLSQKWLLKVKNGMKSDNNRSHVNKCLHLGLWSLGIFHSHNTNS